MKKTLTVLLALLLCTLTIFAVSCDKAQKSREITGSGTEDDPWVCGEGIYDDVFVTYIDGAINVSGDGAMCDFETPDKRPWNDVIEDAESVEISDHISKIGKNAFRDFGKNQEFAYVSVAGDVKHFGESCFEDASLGWYIELNKAKTIGDRAFANAKVESITAYVYPMSIGKDAFENVEAEVTALHFTDEMKESFGGNLSFKDLYTYKCLYSYEDQEDGGYSSTYLEAGEEHTEYADSGYSEMYLFDHWEVVSGTVEIEDPKAEEFTFVPVDDVVLKQYYVKNPDYVEPEYDWDFGEDEEFDEDEFGKFIGALSSALPLEESED